MSHASNILNELNDKFTLNVRQACAIKSAALDFAELQSRSLAHAGKVLEETIASSQAERGICNVFPQIFADSISSIYFSSCGLQNSARIVLRRSLELGIAVLYLWDQPHVYWEWTESDEDLSFSAMIKYLESPGYLRMVREENPDFKSDRLIESADAQRLYRQLSDVVHGKMGALEIVAATNFAFDETPWSRQLTDVSAVASLILTGLKRRFQTLEAELELIVPAIEIVK